MCDPDDLNISGPTETPAEAGVPTDPLSRRPPKTPVISVTP
jgi:hypothetical protein